MDARWMPIVAAAVGVLGGIGGAFIGGTLANEGQEKRFEREEAAADRALRRDAYSTYLGTAQEVWVIYLSYRDAVDAGAKEKAAALADEANAAAVRLYVAQARVDLVAKSPGVRNAAEAVRDALVVDENEPQPADEEAAQDAYEGAADNFRAVARAEIAQALR